MDEKLLCIIKPDAVSKGYTDSICKRIIENGFRIVLSKEEVLDGEKVRRFSSHFSHEPFYEKYINHMTSAPSVLMILEGGNALVNFSILKGATNPKNSEIGTLRRDFGVDMTCNAIHGSDTSESADREINIFFPPITTATLYIISGPSGVGKSTLMKRLVSSMDKLERVVTYTTRKQRENEQDGVDYHFITKEEFEKFENDEILQNFEFSGIHYCALKKPIIEKLGMGIDLIIDVSHVPARKIRNDIPNCKSIYILANSESVLCERLSARKEKSLNERMIQTKENTPYYVEYDNVIFNNDIEDALLELCSIIQTGRTNILYQELKYRKSFESLGIKSPGVLVVLNALSCIPQTKDFLKNISQIKIQMLSGWNNTSYKITYGREVYFLRILRSGFNPIADRFAEKQNLGIAANAGIYTKSLYFDERSGVYLTKFIENKGTLADNKVIKKEIAIIHVVNILKRIHNLESSFLNEANHVKKSQQLLNAFKKSSDNFFGKAGVDVSMELEVNDEKMESKLDISIDMLEDTFKQIQKAGDLALKLCPAFTSCHNDVSPYNLLCTDNGFVLTDWENSGLNDPFYDLANFSIEYALTPEQDRLMLMHYKPKWGCKPKPAELNQKLIKELTWS